MLTKLAVGVGCAADGADGNGCSGYSRTVARLRYGCIARLRCGRHGTAARLRYGHIARLRCRRHGTVSRLRNRCIARLRCRRHGTVSRLRNRCIARLRCRRHGTVSRLRYGCITRLRCGRHGTVARLRNRRIARLRCRRHGTVSRLRQRGAAACTDGRAAERGRAAAGAEHRRDTLEGDVRLGHAAVGEGDGAGAAEGGACLVLDPALLMVRHLADAAHHNDIVLGEACLAVGAGFVGVLFVAHGVCTPSSVTSVGSASVSCKSPYASLPSGIAVSGACACGMMLT